MLINQLVIIITLNQKKNKKLNVKQREILNGSLTSDDCPFT